MARAQRRPTTSRCATLYTEISKVGKKVTAATQAAVKAEAAARARLPPDTRGLVIIMSEIGRGGMNGAVIAIEEARGQAEPTRSTRGTADAERRARSPTGGARTDRAAP